MYNLLTDHKINAGIILYYLFAFFSYYDGLSQGQIVNTETARICIHIVTYQKKLMVDYYHKF